MTQAPFYVSRYFVYYTIINEDEIGEIYLKDVNTGEIDFYHIHEGENRNHYFIFKEDIYYLKDYTDWKTD